MVAYTFLGHKSKLNIKRVLTNTLFCVIIYLSNKGDLNYDKC